MTGIDVLRKTTNLGAELLYIWWQKVIDFHLLNKDYIFTVTTTADQAVKPSRTVSYIIISMETVAGKL